MGGRVVGERLVSKPPGAADPELPLRPDIPAHREFQDHLVIQIVEELSRLAWPPKPPLVPWPDEVGPNIETIGRIEPTANEFVALASSQSMKRADRRAEVRLARMPAIGRIIWHDPMRWRRIAVIVFKAHDARADDLYCFEHMIIIAIDINRQKVDIARNISAADQVVDIVAVDVLLDEFEPALGEFITVLPSYRSAIVPIPFDPKT